VSLALASRRREHCVLALCLSCAAAAWKLSSAPILLFVPIILGHWWTTPSRSLWAISRALGVVLLSGLLFVARSVVLSGYALFPSTAFDVFPVSWKAPELARGQQTWVLLFARGFRHEDPAQALTYPLARWLPIWMHGMNGPSRIVVGFLGAGLLLLPVALVVRRLRKPFTRERRSALAAMAVVAVAGLVFWVWQAPDVRFGASYLTALIALAYVPWLELVGSRPSTRPLVGSAVVLVAVAIVAQNVRFASPVPPWCPPEYVRAHPQRFYWLLPAPYPESSFVEERLRDGSVNYVVASGGLAHYGPVPNSPLPIAGIAVRRGPNLSDGYRVDGGR
jgi:hypothetical protein